MDDVFGSTKKMAQENASKKVTVTEQKTTGKASDTHLMCSLQPCQQPTCWPFELKAPLPHSKERLENS